MLLTMAGGRRPWLQESSCLGRAFISHTVIHYAVLAHHHMSPDSERQLPLSHGLFNSFGLLGASPTLPSPARVAPMCAWEEGLARRRRTGGMKDWKRGSNIRLTDANRPGPNADRGAHRTLWSGSYCQKISHSVSTPHPQTYIPRRCRDVVKTGNNPLRIRAGRLTSKHRLASTFSYTQHLS